MRLCYANGCALPTQCVEQRGSAPTQEALNARGAHKALAEWTGATGMPCQYCTSTDKHLKPCCSRTSQ